MGHNSGTYEWGSPSSCGSNLLDWGRFCPSLNHSCLLFHRSQWDPLRIDSLLFTHSLQLHSHILFIFLSHTGIWCNPLASFCIYYISFYRKFSIRQSSQYCWNSLLLLHLNTARPRKQSRKEDGWLLLKSALQCRHRRSIEGGRLVWSWKCHMCFLKHILEVKAIISKGWEIFSLQRGWERIRKSSMQVWIPSGKSWWSFLKQFKFTKPEAVSEISK